MEDKLVLVQLKGGLGNQLFQYACGRALAIERQAVLALDLTWFNSESARLPYARREYLLDHFIISAHVEIYPLDEAHKIKKHFQTLNNQSRYPKDQLLRFLEKHNSIYHQWHWVKEEDPFTYTPAFFENKKENIFLDGYWQNEAYFKSHREILLQELSPQHQTEQNDVEIEELIQQSNSVSIHIRRGDYVKSEKTHKFHGLLSEKYYREAINKIQEFENNLNFFIFSDDPDWCQKHLSLPIEYEIVSNNQRNAVDELTLMRKCKHHIIANSTFSWWAAWLSTNPHGMTIAPARWLQSSDYNPACPKWIKIMS